MPQTQHPRVPKDQIARFCQQWHVVEFALFGSFLRDDFNEGSDVDVLVSFDPSVVYSFKQIAAMQDELEDIFGRSVDLLDKHAVEQSPNYIRRKAIIDSAEVIYA